MEKSYDSVDPVFIGAYESQEKANTEMKVLLKSPMYTEDLDLDKVRHTANGYSCDTPEEKKYWAATHILDIEPVTLF
jgi:hypothetical protein